MLTNLARTCYQRRRLVVVGWLALLVISGVAGGAFHTDFKLPGSESQKALDILKTKGFGTRTGAGGQIVMEADQGVADPAVRQAMEALFAKVTTDVPGSSIVSPYAPEGARQVARGGRVAYAELNLSDRDQSKYLTVAKQVKADVKAVHVPGLRVDLGGDIFAGFSAPSSEALGFLGAVVILLVAFGSVLAMGLPLLISLLGMFVLKLDAMRGLAIGASLAVLMTMLATLTLLPAVLGFVGRNIDRLSVHRRRKGVEGATQGFWLRWSGVIQRRPWPVFAAGLIVLLALGAPVLSMRLGFSDAANRPITDTTRRAYDLLSAGFGPGFNGPLIVAADTPAGPPDVAALRRLSDQLNHTPGVAFASAPQPNPAGDAAILQVFPTTSPQDQATTSLLHRLRNSVVPAAVAGSTAGVHVGGITAGGEDFSSYISGRLPIFIGAVLILSFLLLMAVFRGLLVALKAVIMNLLSIGAAYGLLVAVFQWGWAKDLVGVGKPGPIEAWAPMMLFAIVFGLSMDYEVFLLSRIREEYDRTGDNGEAVAHGVAVTARVITAAAAIMVVVFGSFVLGDIRAIKLVGLGLAAAVFIDATIVRLVLVPATMELLGNTNWWLPRWLDRALPSIHVETTGELEAELDELARQQRQHQPSEG
ncbi:MAG: MMPL family transporter [Acidimicrobiales bacterium]